MIELIIKKKRKDRVLSFKVERQVCMGFTEVLYLTSLFNIYQVKEIF